MTFPSRIKRIERTNRRYSKLFPGWYVENSMSFPCFADSKDKWDSFQSKLKGRLSPVSYQKLSLKLNNNNSNYLLSINLNL